MDPETTFTRVERTLWTFWTYITEAVNRFIRPQPADNTTNEINSNQESAVHSDNPDVGTSEGEGGGRVEDKEVPTISLLTSSRPVVAWELCTTEVNLKSDEESTPHKTQHSTASKSKGDGEATREEQSGQTRNDEAELVVTEDAKANDEEETKENIKLDSCGRDDTLENDQGEQCMDFGDESRLSDAMSEDEEKSEGEAGAEEESPDDDQITDKIMIELKQEEDNIHRGDKEHVETKDSEVRLFTTAHSCPEEASTMHERRGAAEENDAAADNFDGDRNRSNEETNQARNQASVCEEFSSISDDELIVNRGKHKDTEDQKEDWSVLDIGNVHKASTEQMTEAPEVDIKTADEGSEEAAQNGKMAEFTAEEKEDVLATTNVQTKTHTDMTIDETLAADTKYVDDMGDVDNKESSKDVICQTTSVTVTPQTAQEKSSEYKNIPLEESEGQVVVLHELNTPTCEETQEGVPADNNEPLGPDRNTTQRFLEAGDSEEIHITQLPEEVGSSEQESLENCSCSDGAQYLQLNEPIEEEQERTGDIKNSFDLTVVEQLGIQHLTKVLVEEVFQESGHLTGEDIKRTENSMKTEEFETYIDFADETDKLTEQLKDGTEEQLVKYEMDDSSSFSNKLGNSYGMKESAAAHQEVVGIDEETLKFLVANEQDDNGTQSLAEVTAEFITAETEPQFFDDSVGTKQYTALPVELRGSGGEQEDSEGVKQNTRKMGVTGMATEFIGDKEETESLLGPESAPSQDCETKEISNQSPDTIPETHDKDVITKRGEADESKLIKEPKAKDLPPTETTKHVTESERSYTEEMSLSVSGHQDIIDEEILDLWIETAMSEDYGKLQEGPELGEEVDTKLDKEQGDVILTESISKEFELRKVEMSSPNADSGLLDQSLDEWIAQNSEAQPIKLANGGSLQGTQDILESEETTNFIVEQPNVELSEVSMQESAEGEQSYLKEENSITETESNPDSGVEERHLSEESVKSSQGRVELTESESGSQEKINDEVTELAKKDTEEEEEEDFTSLTKMSTHFNGEDEPLDTNMTESSGGNEHTDSEQSRSSSLDSLKDRILSTNSVSQDNTWTESETNILRSTGLNKTEVIEEPMMKTEDQTEVDAPVLDFTVQRSRIAVKNPRVRPPNNPRSLINMPSVDPTPTSHTPVKVPAGMPLGGMGFGIKLPGLGAGFPVLKKTQKLVKEENCSNTPSQESDIKPDKSDNPSQDEAQRKPKWMPPGHPGFGNPLMSELKTKLKKTTQE
ncbi:uncharacterized protein KZ484_026733 [Pholidichthys leucotaenia]